MAKSPDEVAALALIKEYAWSDLAFRLKHYADPKQRSTVAVDYSERRAALRQILDDLARE